MSSDRIELVDQVLWRSRELSTETVMFHAAIAERRGLSAVETKVLDYLARLGPLTPKDLADYSGLAPASVTALIDRLERKEVLTRKPHPRDRRRVLVELDQAKASASLPLWDDLVGAVRERCEHYSEQQLETIVDFLGAAAAITHESTTRLTSRPAT